MTDSTRSRFRLPHWGWFLLVTVVLVLVGIGLSIWLPWHREQGVVRHFKKWEHAIVETKKGGPDWMRRFIGDECMQVFDRVSSIALSSESTFTDADLEQLTGLASLEGIQLDGSHVTDRGLVHLSKFKNLAFVNLYGTSLTDAGVTYFNGLTNLTLLDVRGTQITRDGVEQLYRALPNCDINHD